MYRMFHDLIAVDSKGILKTSFYMNMTKNTRIVRYILHISNSEKMQYFE